MYVCMCACMDACMYVCMYVHVYVYMYVRTYECTYIPYSTILSRDKLLWVIDHYMSICRKTSAFVSKQRSYTNLTQFIKAFID